MFFLLVSVIVWGGGLLAFEAPVKSAADRRGTLRFRGSVFRRQDR